MMLCFSLFTIIKGKKFSRPQGGKSESSTYIDWKWKSVWWWGWSIYRTQQFFIKLVAEYIKPTFTAWCCYWCQHVLDCAFQILNILGWKNCRKILKWFSKRVCEHFCSRLLFLTPGSMSWLPASTVHAGWHRMIPNETGPTFLLHSGGIYSPSVLSQLSFIFKITATWGYVKTI